MAYSRRPGRGVQAVVTLADRLVDRVAGVALVALLGAVVLGAAASGPEWFIAWRIAALFLVFVGVLIVGRHLFSGDVDLKDAPTVLVLLVGVFAGLGSAALIGANGGPDWSLAGRIAGVVMLGAGLVLIGQQKLADESNASESDTGSLPWVLVVRLTLLVILLFFIYQSSSAGVGLGVHRVGEQAFIFLTLVAFCVLSGKPRRYSLAQWLVIGCFAIVVAIFYYHTLAETAGGLPARRPLWSSVIMGVGLIVLPQYVSKDAFLWALSRLAAALVLLALPIYAIGEYSLYGMPVRFMGEYTVPVIEYEVRATRSLFVNRNAFALVVFAGVVAAAAELHRAIVRDIPVPMVAVPALLFGLNVGGLALAYGRALWVITPMALGIYLASVLDRRLIPVAVIGAFAYLAVGIYAVHSGMQLPGNPPTRASRWYPAFAVLRDQPTLFGQGLVVPREYLATHAEAWPAGSPHNSYVSIFIYLGIVGGLAYLGTIGVSIVRGMWQYRSVDAALLALAVGYAAHQLFEAYTMFRWGPGPVLATLAIGYLAFGWSREGSPSISNNQE